MSYRSSGEFGESTNKSGSIGAGGSAGGQEGAGGTKEEAEKIELDRAYRETDEYGGVVMGAGMPLKDEDGNYVGYGLGPISGRAPGELGTEGVPDYETYQKNQLNNLASTFDLTNPIQKSLYDSIKTKLTSVRPETVTKQQMEAFARQMGTTLDGLQDRYKPEAIRGMAAYGLNKTSLANQTKGIIDTFSKAYNSVAGVPENADYADYGIAAAKSTLAAMTAKDLADIGDQIGYKNLGMGLLNIGSTPFMASKMFSVLSSKPARTAAQTNYTDPVTGLTIGETLDEGFMTALTPEKDVYYSNPGLATQAQGILNAGIFNTDDLGNVQGSLGYNLMNSPIAGMLGVEPSYGGAYVNPQVAFDQGFQYSGNTYGMNPQQFGIVRDNLANPYEGYGEYNMSQIDQMVSNMSQKGNTFMDQQMEEERQQQQDQIAMEQDQQYQAGLTERQFDIYNRLIQDGYGTDYAKLYVEGIN
tara:strand:+ start:252 stop:1664 length:1413 start_codon:yes stop_codon:yes gene_type:complete